jgi:cell division protein FtsI/penicillin-binding protein 2
LPEESPFPLLNIKKKQQKNTHDLFHPIKQKSFAIDEEKKKMKVPDYHFHSDSSRNLPQSNHQIHLFHPLGFVVCERGGEEEAESA